MADFTVCIAESASQRRRGLMHCPQLKTGTGMLFIYAQARPRVFWMKETPLELAIIFISADARIAAIEKGTPASLSRIPSPGPIRQVLEINFEEARGLQVDDSVQLIESNMPPLSFQFQSFRARILAEYGLVLKIGPGCRLDRARMTDGRSHRNRQLALAYSG
ncbi:MAG: DUF192 domain-containing protein [Desulfosarcina sp.]|nr:DUF192 domain-containing protein [Desulfobacterales bacterium]